MLCDARRRSLAMSASLAKSVSVSAKRAERRDSSKRTSSKRIFKSIGGYSFVKEKQKKEIEQLIWLELVEFLCKMIY